MASDYQKLTLGNVLSDAAKNMLTGWMLANITSGKRVRAGLPKSWQIGDKTGAGEYASLNDVAIAWAPWGQPIVLAILSAGRDPHQQAKDSLIAEAASVVIQPIASH